MFHTFNKDSLDKAIDIMKETYESNPKYINPYYQLVEHPTDYTKIGIATICSLSIDETFNKQWNNEQPEIWRIIGIKRISLIY